MRCLTGLVLVTLLLHAIRLRRCWAVPAAVSVLCAAVWRGHGHEAAGGAVAELGSTTTETRVAQLVTACVGDTSPSLYARAVGKAFEVQPGGDPHNRGHDTPGPGMLALQRFPGVGPAPPPDLFAP